MVDDVVLRHGRPLTVLKYEHNSSTLFYHFLSIGWGLVDLCKQKRNPILQETTMKVMKDGECKKAKGSYRNYNATLKTCEEPVNGNYVVIIKDEHICGENDRTSSCRGDSGGPYTVKKDGQHVLVGVNNGGLGCAEVTLSKTQAQHLSINASVNQF